MQPRPKAALVLSSATKPQCDHHVNRRVLGLKVSPPHSSFVCPQRTTPGFESFPVLFPLPCVL